MYEPTNSTLSIILRIDDASFVIDMLGKYSKIFFFIANFVWGLWSYFMFIRISKQLYRMPLNNSLIIFFRDRDRERRNRSRDRERDNRDRSRERTRRSR